MSNWRKAEAATYGWSAGFGFVMIFAFPLVGVPMFLLGLAGGILRSPGGILHPDCEG